MIRGRGAVRLAAGSARRASRRSGRPGGHSEGPNTRSHPELGRENPQRRWYCASRRGRVGRRQARQNAPQQQYKTSRQHNAGWSSPVARQAHNLKVTGSNPVPATKYRYKYKCLPHAAEALPASGASVSGRCPETACPRVSRFVLLNRIHVGPPDVPGQS